jgi:hypothetical protein
MALGTAREAAPTASKSSSKNLLKNESIEVEY